MLIFECYRKFYQNSLYKTITMNETLIIFCIICIIFLVISEIFGRAKHIGRWWTLFLLFGGFLPGLLALIFSPSAKKESTKGGKSYKIWGIISLSFGFLNIILFVATGGKQGYTFIALITLGLYLIQLSNGKVINLNPKFYFDRLTTEFSSQNHFTPKINESINVKYLYFIIIDGNQEGPFTLEQLIEQKINEETLVWRKDLDNWTKASDIVEIKNLIAYNPPPFYDSSHMLPPPIEILESSDEIVTNYYKKSNVIIDSKIIKIVVTSIMFSFLTILLANHFSKKWYFLIDKNDYRYISWLSAKGEDSYKKYEEAMKIKIISFEINSLFGSRIEKNDNTEYTWNDIEEDGWTKGDFERGKFKNYFYNLYFYFLLTMKDWIYFIILSFIVIAIRVFNKNNKIVIT